MTEKPGSPPASAPDGETRNSARNTRVRGRPFEPGNPGKPRGARHKVTRAVEALLEGEAEEITRKAIEAAKAGDMVAVRLVLDRIAPPPRERTVEFQMPHIDGAADLPEAVLSMLTAVAAGELTPAEAAQLVGVLEHYRRQAETADLASRISALEETNGRKA